MSAQRLVLGTRNHHKLRELSMMLAKAGIAAEVWGTAQFGEAPEIVEDGDTFSANAILKANGIAAWLAERGVDGGVFVLADDSGISVDALDGAPAVISARFAGEPCDDAANNRKLVAELQQRGLDRSPAHYTCALALRRVDGAALEGGKTVALFEGRWDVEVRVDARGTGGFGYDPHAWLPNGSTVAELNVASKAEASHRGKALRSMLAWWPRVAARR